MSRYLSEQTTQRYPGHLYKLTCAPVSRKTRDAKSQMRQKSNPHRTPPFLLFSLLIKRMRPQW